MWIALEDPIPQIYHPHIVLFTVEWEHTEMEKIHDLLRRSFPRLCLIKYTGDGVTIEHSSLSLLKLRAGFKNVTAMSDKRFLITGHQLKEVLWWMATSGGGRKTFSQIAIIAGHMASRGINFSTDESPKWHVTHQVLNKPKTTASSNVYQACRILGRFSDEIPLKLIATKEILEKITKGKRLSDALMVKVQEDKGEDHVDKVCQKIFVNAAAKPKKYLRELESRVKTVKTGGLLDPNEVVIANAQTTATTTAIDENVGRFIEIYKKQTASPRDTVIKRILRYMKKHKQATRLELETECRMSNIQHYANWERTHNRHQLLVPQGDVWVLNPKIVEELKHNDLF